jgi:DNA polymerase-3 subunit alpha
MTVSFVHLRARSTYSLLEGAIRIKPLVELAVRHKMPALALTDNDNLFASLDFSLTASGAGVQPIMGCILSFASQDPNEQRSASGKVNDQLLLLAKDEIGYHNLIKLCSKAHLDPEGGNGPLLSYSSLEGYTDGLIALTSGIYGALGKRLLTGRTEAAQQILGQWMKWFPDRLYIELMRHGLDAEKRVEPAFIEMANKNNIALVATNDIYFADADMYDAHDALLCIADGRYVTESDRRRMTPEHHFKSPEEMCELFADIPEAITNTVAIAKRCAVMAVSCQPILPRFADDEAEMLRIQSEAGLEKRLVDHVFTEGMDEAERQRVALPYRERLAFEIATITNMKFPGYFLIVSDFIRWSKEHGIPVGPGRGSGAGSVVAWALLITDLDPLKYGLLFERFLNPERVSMPDFDVDFCQDRRDEVISYVQKKYGADRVAQIITFGKLQARAVLRDVGRVLQLPYGQVDGICKFVPNNPAAPVTLDQAIQMEPALQKAIEDDESVARMVSIALKLEGLNRHASTHAAGVVIGDRPLEELVPLYRDPKSDIRVVQYSMKYAELAGLVKFDFLGLKTLTVLKKAVELVARKGIEIDLLKLPEGDKKTYAMLSAGDTTGVFQMESTGMRDTLKRLKPDCLEDLIALVSLYRPGPMDNIPTYINRKHGKEKPEYLHPKLEVVLRETFGVIIYQEQVMQIAQVLAGYSLGEADLLRRAMGKKIRAEMEAQRTIFVERAVANEVPKAQATSIFDLIAKFAEYGFNKSHAAAYALIAYQTGYMKANYPVEFFAASMTYDMHNTDKLSVFREEAQRTGIKLLPPDINMSEAMFTPEGNDAIRYGLAALRNVGAQAMQQLADERARGGPFKTVWDMASRLDAHVMNRRQMEYLIKAGAFDSLHRNRNQLISSLDLMLAFNNTIAREKESKQTSLFGGDAAEPPPLPAMAPCEDFTAMQRMEFENEALGFYLSSHPIQGYRSTLSRLGVVPSSQFATRLGTSYGSLKIAGLVSKIKIRTSDKGRFAFVTLSDEGGVFEMSVFKEEILSRYRPLLEGGALIVAQVDGKRGDDGMRLILQSLQPLEEAIASVKGAAMPKKLRITIDSEQAVSRLQSLLGGQVTNAGARITLCAAIEAHAQAEVTLPGCYALTPEILMQIPALEGVCEFSDAA